MKTKLLSLFIISVMIISCSENNSNKGNSNNLLLYNNLEVQYKPDTTFFQNKFNFSFFEKLTVATNSGKIPVYDFPLYSFDFNGSLDVIIPENIKNILKSRIDTVITEDTITNKTTKLIFNRNFINDTKSIYFVEEWNLNNDLKFTKRIKYYAPVWFYYSSISQNKKLQSIPFVISNQDLADKKDKDLISIAKHISYTVNLDADENNGLMIFGLNKQKLQSLLVDSIIKNKTSVYDIDLNKLDISTSALTNEQVKHNLGERADTSFDNSNHVSVDLVKATDNKRQIKALFFIEDWYYDPETFSIKKNIIGFGPVREFENPAVPNLIQRTIPYIIRLTE